MSPDTLPAPSPVRRDTHALQPPPLIPSRPAGLRGRCHSVAIIPDPRVLDRRGDDGGVKNRKRGDERRGIKPQLDPRELFLIYLHLCFCIFLTTHCRSWAKNHQLSSTSVFFRQEEQKQKLFNQIIDRTNFSSESHCVELSDLLSDTRIPLRFQFRGYYYLIPPLSCTRLQI